MSTSKVTPALWFNTTDGSLHQVIDYYTSIFGNNFQAGTITSLGKTPSGNTEICSIIFFGTTYSIMSTETSHHPFNDSISLIISCENQEEIDCFWNYFTEEGQESMCGWCIDKFGLRWQIIPANMSELMSKPNAGRIMMKQRKIVIAEYL